MMNHTGTKDGVGTNGKLAVMWMLVMIKLFIVKSLQLAIGMTKKSVIVLSTESNHMT